MRFFTLNLFLIIGTIEIFKCINMYMYVYC